MGISEDDLWSRLRQKSSDDDRLLPNVRKKRPQPVQKAPKRKPTSTNHVTKPQTIRPDTKQSQGDVDNQARLSTQPRSKTLSQVTSKNQKIPLKKLYLMGGAVAAIALIGGGVYFGLQRQNDPGGPQSLGITDEMQANLENVRPVEELSFRPYYPEDFDERGVEFVQQIRGDTEYVTYVDSLDGTNFTVTQQLVTAEIAQGGNEQVESLAKAMPIPATGTLQIDDTVVFVGVSEQNRQALLFTKENILLFISTEGLISEPSWVGYIMNLTNGI